MTAYAHLLLYFFFYSFVGWIWESSYVSILTKRLTNRGFLTGPMLPIYGIGAVVMLCATYPVQSSDVGIFLLGLIAATMLEYVTGVVMEALFQVRYWDYSDKKFNIQGHILPKLLACMGCFYTSLIRVVHPSHIGFIRKDSSKCMLWRSFCDHYSFFQSTLLPPSMLLWICVRFLNLLLI